MQLELKRACVTVNNDSWSVSLCQDQRREQFSFVGSNLVSVLPRTVSMFRLK